MVDLKTFLSLAMPNQYCYKVNIEPTFWGKNSQTFMISILYCAWEDQSEKVCCIVHEVLINCITLLYEP